MGVERRLGLARVEFAEADADGFLVDFDQAGGVFAALAVEHHQLRVFLQAQHVAQVVGAVFFQPHGRAGA